MPYSGGTGLVGGQIFGDGPLPVILSFERMARIRDLDLTDGVLVAEAGCVLADVQAAAREAGRLFPLTLASEGSARIGGLLGTNAGGVNVLRYGNARDLCLGVEAVMADGSVLHGLSRVVKDNMGYDLRHLLIGVGGDARADHGREPAALSRAGRDRDRLARRRLARGGAGAPPGAARGARRHDLGLRADPRARASPSWPRRCRGSRCRRPWPADWRVLVESADAAGAGVGAAAGGGAGRRAGGGLVDDALIAQSAASAPSSGACASRSPRRTAWSARSRATTSRCRPSRLAEFVARGPPAIAAIDPELRINCFGHLGDGNLHYNVFPPPGRSRDAYDSLREPVKRTVHDLVHELGGSVGAEHGVGRLKVEDLVRYGDPAKLAAMRAIKQALDPLGILNPGAVLA